MSSAKRNTSWKQFGYFLKVIWALFTFITVLFIFRLGSNFAYNWFNGHHTPGYTREAGLQWGELIPDAHCFSYGLREYFRTSDVKQSYYWDISNLISIDRNVYCNSTAHSSESKRPEGVLVHAASRYQ